MTRRRQGDRPATKAASEPGEITDQAGYEQAIAEGRITELDPTETAGEPAGVLIDVAELPDGAPSADGEVAGTEADSGRIESGFATGDAPAAAAVTPPAMAPRQQRVRVTRGIPCGGGKVIEPGSILTVGADLPYHRVRQFIEQRYVVALEPGEA